jgi:acyl-CoA thioesterase-1
VQKYWKNVVVVIVFAIAIWALWPAPKIANLASRGTNIIAFGDSLTAGYGAVAGEDYPSRLAAITGIPILNAGVSGDTTDTALARLDSDVLARDPRIVIVGLGGNDFLRGAPIGTTEANLRTIIRKIHAAGAMVVILGYKFPSLQANYEKMYERVAKDEQCLLVPDLLDGIESNPQLKSDEIHPNARGYQLIAERVAGPLRKLLRRAK